MPAQTQTNGGKSSPAGKRSYLSCVIFVILAAVAIFAATSVGAVGGYQSGLAEYKRQQSVEAIKSLQEQYDLGLQDLDTGQYDLARQRFEYVLDHDPNFPGAADKLVQVMQVLFATSTPTPVPPTATPTPTPDLRPVEELLSQAQQDYTQANWSAVIDVLLNLRKADPAYHVVEVDSLLYRSLRHRGLKKIREEASLEGGMYDLTLAENFGPLDVEAENWRNLARIYMIGLGFWEVHPEQAVYYFGQVASAAPGLRDGSGWSASGRYWASLVHYADLLASRSEWCDAQEQYDAALSRSYDGSVQEKADDARIKCSPPTNTPKPSATTGAETPTSTTAGETPVPTPTNTQQAPPIVTQPPTATATQPSPPTPTNTQPPPPPTDTSEPPPTEEPTSTTSAPYPGPAQGSR